MTNKEPSDNTAYVASLKFLDVEKRYKPGPKHYMYVIQVTWSNPTNVFIIYRRYAQFFDLQCKLLDLFAETCLEANDTTQLRQIPFLPGKIILGRSQIRQIALERKEALDKYCQTLISLSQRISRSRPILEFFHPLSTDVQKTSEPGKKPIIIDSLVISAPTKLATYRCLDDFIATDKLEMSIKRGIFVQVLQKHANGWWFIQHGDQKGFVPGTYLEPSEQERGARETKTLETSLNEICVVNNRYEGKTGDELSLDQGSFVTVIEKSFTGWWRINFNGVTGQFPAIYLSSCAGRYTPENITNDVSDGNSPKSLTKRFTEQSNDSDWDDDEEYHTESSNGTNPELYYAHSSFMDDTGDCSSFQRGDLIEIHDKNTSGWWFGRRMKGGHVLTWIPANYLQKEPIINESVDTTNNHSEYYSNMPDIVPHPPVEQQEKISTETIYQNLETQPTTEVIYSEVVKPQHLKTKTTTLKKSSYSTSLPSIIDKQDPTQKSVKDLVKKFNRT